MICFWIVWQIVFFCPPLEKCLRTPMFAEALNFWMVEIIFLAFIGKKVLKLFGDKSDTSMQTVNTFCGDSNQCYFYSGWKWKQNFPFNSHEEWVICLPRTEVPNIFIYVPHEKKKKIREPPLEVVKMFFRIQYHIKLKKPLSLFAVAINRGSKTGKNSE